MAIAYHTEVPACSQDQSTDQSDLIRRYCPGLAAHSPEQIAQHIPADPTFCWPWDGEISPQGYGTVWTQPTAYGYKQSVPVHRYMYNCLVGEVDPVHHVHHECRYRACWNVFHLKEVTPKEHLARHRQLHNETCGIKT